MSATSYTRIPGSDRLKTRPRGQGEAAVVESAPRGGLAAREVDGKLLTRTVIREHFVPVLLDVFDRLALEQEPEEQALYLHLWRLSVVDERNFCRVSRAELRRRLHVSERRLGKALAGLVAKGHVSLVERDRDGTLYRVALPHELHAGVVDDAVQKAPRVRKKTGTTLLPQAAADAITLLPQAASAPEAPPPVDRPTSDAPTTLPRSARSGLPRPADGTHASGSSSSTSARASSSSPAARSVGDVCRWFSKQYGTPAGRKPPDVAEQVLFLLEEGYTFPRVLELLARFVAAVPTTTSMAELPRWLAREAGD